jgi:hypothetical protein
MSEQMALVSRGEGAACIGDIFADVRELVCAVPEGRKKRQLEAAVAVKEAEFYRAYDDSRYQHNGQDAYGLLGTFVGTVEEGLRDDDEQSRAVADFIRGFCGDMYEMWGTRAMKGETHFGRIEERMLRYSEGIGKLKGMAREEHSLEAADEALVRLRRHISALDVERGHDPNPP